MRKRNAPGKGRKKTCGKCGGQKEREKQGYCNGCHAEYMRKNRIRHSDLSDEQRLKANARSYVNVYLRRGKIEKKPCEICGELKVEMHHDDYNKPLQIKWLCRKHHLEIHN